MAIRTLGVYYPGTSFLHRLPAAAKLVGLVLWAIAVAVGCRQLTWVALPLVLIIGLLAAVRAPLRVIWSQLWPALPLLGLIGLYQWWAVSWQEALRITGIILCCILGAISVTLTTRASDMIDGYVLLLRPLSRLGVPTDRIALAFALTLQTIPAISAMVNEVRESLWSRGATRSLRALTSPLLSRVLHYADGVGDALVARGIDDSSSHS